MRREGVFRANPPTVQPSLWAMHRLRHQQQGARNQYWKSSSIFWLEHTEAHPNPPDRLQCIVQELEHLSDIYSCLSASTGDWLQRPPLGDWLQRPPYPPDFKILQVWSLKRNGCLNRTYAQLLVYFKITSG